MSTNDEFLDIAANIVSDEANDYLDKRINGVDKWVEHRLAQGHRADLRDLIEKIMREPNDRGPVIITLCAALWRLREMRENDG